MTTNITALVQRLKVAAKNGCCHTIFPDDCLALVEALEKAQTKAIEQGRTACELFDEVTALRQRIAELESRTVKLPERYACELGYNAPDPNGDMLDRDDVIAALTDAGIKVEAE
ncbi:TPA: hypothetical protein MIM69_25990 [Klebsiella variicola]|nr:hypothetical protein [Klebsiella variicola]